MKKFLITLTALFAMTFVAMAQTTPVIISGHVTNLSSVPIPNHTVWMSADSTGGFYYYNSKVTDVNGYYADTVQVPNAVLPVTFWVSTSDCNGTYVNHQGTSSGAPVVADFSICDTIVPATCTASFIAYLDTVGGSQYTYSFYDYSNPAGGNITSWAWSFGDGTGSSVQNPVHQYGPGTWTACLTITTDLGCSSNYCITVSDSGYNQGCWSYFNYQTSGGNMTYSFLATTSSTTPTQYTWDYGDGTIVGPGNYPATTYTYTTSGYYNVCLTTQDSSGCSYVSCQNIYAGTAMSCSANFYLYPDSLTPHHYYAVNMAYGTPPLTYLWNWGDGTSSTGAYPSHTFATAGFYTICLTITDTVGCTSTFCDSVNIQKSGNSMISVNVIPSGTTGISEVQDNSTFLIYPNPAQNTLYLENISRNADISIFDFSGRNVMNVKGASTIDISSLAKGVYCVRLSGENGFTVKRFVKE
jgi:PKD repeat protein